MKHPFNQAGCSERLIAEYELYQNLVVGFDFDNTIFDYWDNGGDYSEIIEILREAKNVGFTLCLYTCESSTDRLNWKISYCDQLGIMPDYINSSPIYQGTKKPFFNVLLDDRAGLESAYNNLKSVINYANSKLSKSREE